MIHQEEAVEAGRLGRRGDLQHPPEQLTVRTLEVWVREDRQLQPESDQRLHAGERAPAHEYGAARITAPLTA